jgi:hypothetical protein
MQLQGLVTDPTKPPLAGGTNRINVYQVEDQQLQERHTHRRLRGNEREE